MKNKFLVQDYGQKIDGTFVQYKGVIYYGRCDGNNIILRDPATDKIKYTIDGCDDDLNLASIKLGFFNLVDSKMGIYIQRMPYRKVKQGVADSNILIEALTDRGFQNIGSNNIHANGVADGFNSKYPTLTSAGKLLIEQGWTSVAISSEMGIRRAGATYQVFFKKENIGTYDFTTNELNIPNSTFSMLYSKFVGNFPWVVK